jgi:hypothetical protein
MKWGFRALAVFAALSALIAFTGWAVAGLPPKPKELPTGDGVTLSLGKNTLSDGEFSQGGSIAKGWLQEYNTEGKPVYLRSRDVQEIAYAGEPEDTGVHHKIEVFQALWHGVEPGQRWQFSIRVKGQISKGYVIAGMEWFSVYKHVVGKVVGYGYNYIAEQDVYPQVTTNWQQITAVSPKLPSNAKCVAVYVQLPEINDMTRVDVKLTNASLVLKASR